MHLPLNPKKAAYLKGQRGEWIASLYLRCKGYTILESRFKTPLGEIDLLIRKGSILVAVEVKSRNSLENAAFSITPHQQRRIERALIYYLSRQSLSFDIRFDVIIISPWRWPYHLIDAWRY